VKRPIIAPSILAADFSRLGEQVAQAERAGADWFHLDVMDGRFVPNISFGPAVVRTVRDATKLPLDVHLMIEQPEKYIDAFRSAGADVITVHQEASLHLHRVLTSIRETGAKAGVSINPSTPVSMLEPIVAEADLVLIMSVNPGYGGQKFIHAALDKIAQTRTLIDRSGSRALLEVDGGIGPENAGRIVAAGADILVAGTSVFHQQDMAKAIASLRIPIMTT